MVEEISVILKMPFLKRTVSRLMHPCWMPAAASDCSPVYTPYIMLKSCRSVSYSPRSCDSSRYSLRVRGMYS